MNWDQHALVCVFLAVFGAAVGSFVNVCVYRIPLGLSLLWPRSRCPNCRQPVALRDNLPILGWLLLCGRCRHCHEPISRRYPLVELVIALILPALYLFEAAGAMSDPLEGGVLKAGVPLFGGFFVATFLLAVALVDFDRRARVEHSQLERTGDVDSP